MGVEVISKSERVPRSPGTLSLGLERRYLDLNLRDMQRVCAEKVATVPVARKQSAASAGAVA